MPTLLWRSKQGPVTNYYQSPRWSGEITDCGMPMTFDQYSLCSYRCLYCFSFFQRAIGGAKEAYIKANVKPVNVERVKRIFTDPDTSQFGGYVKQGLALQWGGLSDPFDEYEREMGVGLELIRFFRKLEHPVSFSTKGVWWTKDDRYTSLFKNAQHFNVKVSIITLDKQKSHDMECLCPSPTARLHAIERLAKLNIGGVTLRLRPFIIGVSTPSYLELIRKAADAGAEAVSTEFMCVETRARRAKRRFATIGRVAGYNLMKMYKRASPGQTGYLRLSREVKLPYVNAMEAECKRLGLRFYVSDAHFKERCHGGCCCGTRDDWPYSKGQFTEALLIARREGRVGWGDIAKHLDWANVLFGRDGCGNKTTVEMQAQFHGFTQRDWLRYHWNSVNGGKGPYKYFGGVLYPVGRDEAGDVIYEYRGDK